MKSVHLLRKPCAATSITSNVLDHGGTGGLNIDASRLYCGDDHVRKGNVGRQIIPSGDERDGKALGMFHPESKFIPTNHPGGRWPANVILKHDVSDCRLCQWSNKIGWLHPPGNAEASMQNHARGFHARSFHTNPKDRWNRTHDNTGGSALRFFKNLSEHNHENDTPDS